MIHISCPSKILSFKFWNVAVEFFFFKHYNINVIKHYMFTPEVSKITFSYAANPLKMYNGIKVEFN